MARIIQMLRGLKRDLPALKPGQIALTTDEHKLYVGSDDSANHGVSMDGHTHDPVSVGGIPIVTTYTPDGGTDGKDYAVDIPGVTEPYTGLTIIVVPHVNSTYDTLTLKAANISKPIRRPAAPNMNNIQLLAGAPIGGSYLLRKDRPYILMYFVLSWIAVSYPIAQLDNAYGYLPSTKGGTGLNGVTKDNYLVGNNTDPMVEKSPQEVREHIGAAEKTITVDSGLTVGGWAGSGPYTQTRVVTGLTEDSNAIVGLAQTATAEQREAARDAMLSVTGQTGSSIIVTADGDKPTVNIPIVVTLLG